MSLTVKRCLCFSVALLFLVFIVTIPMAPRAHAVSEVLLAVPVISAILGLFAAWGIEVSASGMSGSDLYGWVQDQFNEWWALQEGKQLALQLAGLSIWRGMLKVGRDFVNQVREFADWIVSDKSLADNSSTVIFDNEGFSDGTYKFLPFHDVLYLDFPNHNNTVYSHIKVEVLQDDITVFYSPFFYSSSQNLRFYFFAFNFDTSQPLLRVYYDYISNPLVYSDLSSATPGSVNIGSSDSFISERFYRFYTNTIYSCYGNTEYYMDLFPTFVYLGTNYSWTGIDSLLKDSGRFWSYSDEKLSLISGDLVIPGQDIDEGSDAYIDVVGIPLTSVEQAGEAIQDAVMEGELDVQVEVADQASPPAGSVEQFETPGLSEVFPFCIPFDIYAFFSVLASDPVAPSFSWDMEVPGLVDYTIEIDLSIFDTVAQVVRTMELLAFCVALAVATRDLIKG